MSPRELIINVDDIGIHSGAVDAAIEVITRGVAASGSVMVVCPGANAALDLLAGHPEVPVGVHLTLTADFSDAPWSPLTAGASIQENGRLLGIERREQLLAQAVAGEVEAEFRAQIEALIDAGVQPTHLDWHCLADGGRDDIFDLTMELAVEYGIGIRAWTDHGRDAVRSRGRTAQDQPFLDSFAAPVEGRLEWFLDRISEIRDGLTEWAMHPARPATLDKGSDLRVSDRELLLSASIRQALDDEEITVLGHGDLTLDRP
ncbi:MAG: ChbG/HpnK family deacetylase [Pseudonocardia sp.]|nr:ChbG/HpnK family deacetylase [Pseudonocardia sp.]